MGVIAVALKKFIEQGVTGAPLIELVEEMEIALAENMRSAAAERAARWRGRLGMSSSEWRDLRIQILARDAETCRYCDGAATHVDHVIPLIAGGGNDASNLVACCETCNRSKSGRSPEEWIAQ